MFHFRDILQRVHSHFIDIKRLNKNTDKKNAERWASKTTEYTRRLSCECGRAHSRPYSLNIAECEKKKSESKWNEMGMNTEWMNIYIYKNKKNVTWFIDHTKNRIWGSFVAVVVCLLSCFCWFLRMLATIII